MSGAGFKFFNVARRGRFINQTVNARDCEIFVDLIFLADDATAILSPAPRTRFNRSGTAEKGRTSGRYFSLKCLARQLSSSSRRRGWRAFQTD